MLYPSLEEVKKLAAQPGIEQIPVKMEMFMDMLTPIEAVRIIKGMTTHCFLLESAQPMGPRGRYSFIGYDPELEITCTDHEATIKSKTAHTVKTPHPAEIIRKILKENKAPVIDGMPQFTGGLAGYFAYDYIRYAEPKLELTYDDGLFKDADLMLFHKIIAFDHYRQKIDLICHVSAKEAETSYKKAEMTLESLARLLMAKQYAPNPPLKLKGPLKAQFSKERYCEMVKKAKKYIYEGDIFQVVLSNRMEAPMTGSLFDTYRVLRTTNPSPYMFYFSGSDLEIAGASPETLVRLENQTVTTFPLAGTRKRGASEKEDAAIREELLSDEKERAEHNMLVDLGRNDLGKVSDIGTVNVEKYMSVETFSHVMHIGSQVSGRLRKDKDALDVIDAVLPAGTLSGAPKFRACEIIHELEGSQRGIYGGAIGYLDLTGNMDVCISIRLAYAKDGRVFVQSGAGIVADSDPEKEYEECQNKARAVAEALKAAEGGLYDCID